MVEVILGTVGDFTLVHIPFSFRTNCLPDMFKSMLAGLEAIQALRALLLLKENVLWSHLVIFEVGQHLNTKLILSIHRQIEICMILSPKPVWILLALNDIRLVARVAVQIRIPWLIKSFHGEE